MWRDEISVAFYQLVDITWVVVTLCCQLKCWPTHPCSSVRVCVCVYVCRCVSMLGGECSGVDLLLLLPALGTPHLPL